jgi:hypothetical protein
MCQFDNMQAGGLDGWRLARKWPRMTRTPLLIAFAAAAALAGCNNNQTIDPNQTDEANVAANKPVALPPSITASKIYRCADNKVVYVDWLSDNKSANIRTEQTGALTKVTAAEPGKPMTAPGGFELSGTQAASTARIAVPGHRSQSCKA